MEAGQPIDCRSALSVFVRSVRHYAVLANLCCTERDCETNEFMMTIVARRTAVYSTSYVWNICTEYYEYNEENENRLITPVVHSTPCLKVHWSVVPCARVQPG